MRRKKLTNPDVLRYSLQSKAQGTVRRFYVQWRTDHGIPPRCDNPNCMLHEADPEWNGAALPLILDHVDGNRRHNRVENLRLLCPNCDAQLPTRGGKNKGRIQNATADAFHTVDRRTGRRDVTVFLTGISMKAELGDVSTAANEKKRVLTKRSSGRSKTRAAER